MNVSIMVRNELRRPVPSCFGLSMLTKFLRLLSTSALPSCRPAVMSAVLCNAALVTGV